MKYLLTAITAGLLLAACSAPPETGKTASQSANKENVKMTENKTPLETQRAILTGVLEMMETSSSIKDFTRERLEQVFGMRMIARENEVESYFFSKELTDNWWWGIDKSKGPVEKQDGLELFFEPTEQFRSNHEPNENPDIGEICGMGFDEFVQKAEKLGFTQEPNIVQDGMQMGVYLNKGDLQVKVLPLYYYSANDPTEQRICIRMIQIG